MTVLFSSFALLPPLGIFILVATAIGLLIVFILLYYDVFGLRRESKLGVSNVVISPSPRTILKGSGRKIKVQVVATGFTTTPETLNYRIDLYQDEFGRDDKLVSFTTQSNVDPGIRPMRVDLGPQGGGTSHNVDLFTWTITKDLFLSCDADGDIFGSNENSDDEEVQLYAEFTILFGNPRPKLESRRILVKCVETEEELDEGSMQLEEEFENEGENK